MQKVTKPKSESQINGMTLLKFGNEGALINTGREAVSDGKQFPTIYSFGYFSLDFYKQGYVIRFYGYLAT